VRPGGFYAVFLWLGVFLVRNGLLVNWLGDPKDVQYLEEVWKRPIASGALKSLMNPACLVEKDA